MYDLILGDSACGLVSWTTQISTASSTTFSWTLAMHGVLLGGIELRQSLIDQLVDLGARIVAPVHADGRAPGSRRRSA